MGITFTKKEVGKNGKKVSFSRATETNKAFFFAFQFSFKQCVERIK